MMRIRRISTNCHRNKILPIQASRCRKGGTSHDTFSHIYHRVDSPFFYMLAFNICSFFIYYLYFSLFHNVYVILYFIYLLLFCLSFRDLSLSFVLILGIYYLAKKNLPAHLNVYLRLKSTNHHILVK